MLDYQINDSIRNAYNNVLINEGETWDKIKEFGRNVRDTYTEVNPETGERSLNWKELGNDAFDTLTDTYVDKDTGKRKIDKLGLAFDVALGLGSLGATATGVGAPAGVAGASALTAKYGTKMAAKMAARAAAKAAAKAARGGIVKKIATSPIRGAKNVIKGAGKAILNPVKAADKIAATKLGNMTFELPIAYATNGNEKQEMKKIEGSQATDDYDVDAELQKYGIDWEDDD